MSKTRIEKRIEKGKKDVLKALNDNMGIVAGACRKAGISRYTYYKWYNEDELFAEKCDDVKELQKDFAEALILKKMKDGDTTMLIFYAKTQMKDRGYNERQEITGADGAPLMEKQIDISKLSDEQIDLLLSIGETVLNEKEN